jgi:long-subunit acyl-CoA synthetase (AMP-forming)
VVKQGYGMTETCPTVFNQTWDDWNNPIGSTGELLPNVEAKICPLLDTSENLEAANSQEPNGLPQWVSGRDLCSRSKRVFRIS